MASQVENSSQLLFPKSSFPILQQRKCNKHPNRQLTFLCTNPADSESSVFKCEECLIEQGLESQYLILLSSIYNSDDKTVFLNWPIPGDKEITDKIKALSKLPMMVEKLENDVDRYFKELRQVVFDKIDKMHEQVKKQASHLINQQDKIYQQYNIVSAKQELKEAVMDRSTETSALSKRIKNTVAAVLANEEQSKSTLRNRIEELQSQENSINFEGLHIIRSNILQALDAFTLFSGENQFSQNPEIFSCIKELNHEQLSNLTILGLKMKELSQKYSASYDQQTVLKQDQQKNSYAVCQLLRKYKEFNKNTTDEFEHLLVKYPVFELTSEQLSMDIQQFSIFDDTKSISWNWVLSNLADSQQLSLCYSNNGVSVLQKESLTGQAVTQYILQKDLVYSFTCRFNQPLNRCRCIRIGLIENDVMNCDLLGQKNDLCFESNVNNNKDILRGEFLNSDSLSKTLTTIHFKICLQTKTFLFSDETHENVNTVTDQINPEGQYRVGILFWTPGDDYSCEFSDVRVSENLATANQY